MYSCLPYTSSINMAPLFNNESTAGADASVEALKLYDMKLYRLQWHSKYKQT